MGNASAVVTATLANCPAVPIAVGSTVAGTLSAGDCFISDRPTDRYEYTSIAGTTMEIVLESTDFSPAITVNSSSGAPVGRWTELPPNARFFVISAAGTRIVGARAVGPETMGDYTLRVQAATPSGCGPVFIERGVSTTQQLETTDCYYLSYDYNPVYRDEMLIYMRAGSVIVVDASSAAFTPILNALTPGGSFIGQPCIDQDATSCQFPVQEAGYYTLVLSTLEENAVGAYTLTIH